MSVADCYDVPKNLPDFARYMVKVLDAIRKERGVIQEFYAFEIWFACKERLDELVPPQ